MYDNGRTIPYYIKETFLRYMKSAHPQWDRGGLCTE